MAMWKEALVETLLEARRREQRTAIGEKLPVEEGIGARCWLRSP